jgi:hypothetical protein
MKLRRSSFYLEVWADSDVEATGSKQYGGDMPRGKGELDVEVEQVWDDALGKQAVQGVEFEEEEPRDEMGLQGWSGFKSARSRADYVLHPLLVARMESLDVGELWEQWKPQGSAKAREWFESDKVRALDSRFLACFAWAHSRSAIDLIRCTLISIDFISTPLSSTEKVIFENLVPYQVHGTLQILGTVSAASIVRGTRGDASHVESLKVQRLHSLLQSCATC